MIKFLDDLIKKYPFYCNKELHYNKKVFLVAFITILSNSEFFEHS